MWLLRTFQVSLPYNSVGIIMALKSFNLAETYFPLIPYQPTKAAKDLGCFIDT